ncbi:MAG: A/G-specific adenine glycosylase [Bacteroidia bacterium]|nr:A/G-specific adenine glycosylase [Bacteroidia bacterium]
MNIGQTIIDWYESYGRNLPWRETRDPYKIWISEVILQQTRIAQGIDYYRRFIQRFPDVHSLASASLDEVLKYWEGLGYYSRARNLHAAARQICEDHKGIFPNHYSVLQTLKGIGPYTARAIGSFAFDNATGVIDGNVLRVMSRVLGDPSPINKALTRNRFQTIIDGWVNGLDSRLFNNGIMDLGSTVCTPTQPGCLVCPLHSNCRAYQEGLTAILPIKEKSAERKTRYYHFYIALRHEGDFLIRQRPSHGLWGGLWEIPNEEVDEETWGKKSSRYTGKILLEMKHVFSHFDMIIRVFILSGDFSGEWPEAQFISPDKISIFAFSKAVLKIFDKWQNTD